MRRIERGAAALFILLFTLLLAAADLDPSAPVWENLNTKRRPTTIIAGSVLGFSLDGLEERALVHRFIERTVRSIMTPQTLIFYGSGAAIPAADAIFTLTFGTAYSFDAPPYLYVDATLYRGDEILLLKRYSAVCPDCPADDLPIAAAGRLFLRLIELMQNDRELYDTARSALGAKTVPKRLPVLDPVRIITTPDFKPLIFPVFMTLNLRTLFGTTWVDIYDKKNSLSAAGVGTILEEKVTVSFGDPDSGWYITPDIGFFYRRLVTKDFAFDTSDINRSVDGFVPGITRDDADGQYIEVFSLSYDSQFYSLYFGGHGGYQLVVGTSDFQFTLHPSVYLNVLELRWTKFAMGLDRRASQMRPHFFGSLGATLEAGFFIPAIRTGLRVGTDISYFAKFKLPDNLSFKRVERKRVELEPGRSVDLYLPEEFYVQESTIFSVLGYVDVYFVF